MSETVNFDFGFGRIQTFTFDFGFLHVSVFGFSLRPKLKNPVFSHRAHVSCLEWLVGSCVQGICYRTSAGSKVPSLSCHVPGQHVHLW